MSAVCYIGTNFHGNIKVIGAMTKMRRDNCICHLYSLENDGMMALTLLTGVDSLLVLVLTVRFSVSPPWLLPSW